MLVLITVLQYIANHEQKYIKAFDESLHIWSAFSRAPFNTAIFIERSCQIFSVLEDKQTQIKQGDYSNFRAVTYWDLESSQHLTAIFKKCKHQTQSINGAGIRGFETRKTSTKSVKSKGKFY